MNSLLLLDSILHDYEHGHEEDGNPESTRSGTFLSFTAFL